MDRDAPATGSEFSQPAAPRMPSPNLDGDPAIDVSHVNEGYVSARATDAARLKFQVKSGDMTYNYDLPNTGEEAVFPINMGSGTYEFRIMRNTEGSNYVELMSEPAEVALESEFVPFDETAIIPLPPRPATSPTPTTRCARARASASTTRRSPRRCCAPWDFRRR